MEKYFEATVAFIETVETKDGVKEKKRKEKYLVSGDTPTVVEARIHEFLKNAQVEFETEWIKESKIIEVF
jgi:hypothetical protein